MGLKAGRGNKTRGLNIFLVLTKIQGIYGSRFFYSKANQKLIPFFYESLFRKCLGGARTAPGGPGGPRFGNLAIWQLRNQTQRERGGGVTVKELVVGTPWYQNERYEFHMACHAWLKASCIEKGGEQRQSVKTGQVGGGGGRG